MLRSLFVIAPRGDVRAVPDSVKVDVVPATEARRYALSTSTQYGPVSVSEKDNYLAQDKRTTLRLALSSEFSLLETPCSLGPPKMSWLCRKS